MKKEYKTPMLSVVNVNTENLMLNASEYHDYDSADGKKSGRIYDDEDAAPAAPKKFWDDEE